MCPPGQSCDAVAGRHGHLAPSRTCRCNDLHAGLRCDHASSPSQVHLHGERVLRAGVQYMRWHVRGQHAWARAGQHRRRDVHGRWTRIDRQVRIHDILHRKQHSKGRRSSMQHIVNQPEAAMHWQGGLRAYNPISPNSPILFLPKPYLVLRDTLCSCEAYGMRPMYKKKKSTASAASPLPIALQSPRFLQLASGTG